MKHSILILAFIISSFFSFSQTVTPVEKKGVLQYELGMNLVCTGPSVISWTGLGPNHGQIQYLSGMYFRITKGKNVFRTSLGQFKESRDFYSSTLLFHYDRYLLIHASKISEVTLGYQRNLSRGRWIPYFYGDLVFKSQKLEGIDYSVMIDQSIHGPRSSVSGVHYESKTYAVGLAAGFGLKFKLNKRISFLYEANFGKQVDVSGDRKWHYGKRNMYRKTFPAGNPLRTLGISFQF